MKSTHPCACVDPMVRGRMRRGASIRNAPLTRTSRRTPRALHRCAVGSSSINEQPDDSFSGNEFTFAL
ncbi:hypothetical protein Y032_0011g1459 [Ancylostoma ceylanicum]|uniref:Uncharacterized protein n=1 Tax=Ancylostoma ceylanicum TaxID=53326 RepID=A0A016VF47_9BILA|nr:hypothetical protein Y032_0011g1459 [Ancylostoma ceylanicum]